jgi:hypothetical protein
MDTVNKNFPLEPSDEFLRLKRAADVARKAWLTSFSEEDWSRLRDEFQAIVQELHRTPEQQFLDEMKSVESEAWTIFMDGEARKRERMVSLLSLEPEDGQKVQAAIEDQCFSSHAAACRFPVDNSVLAVLVDMRKMTAAQAAVVLRKMAAHIEKSGIAIYRGTHPTDTERRSDWIVDERVDGTLSHSCHWVR